VVAERQTKGSAFRRSRGLRPRRPRLAGRLPQSLAGKAGDAAAAAPGDQSLIHLCRPREGGYIGPPVAGIWVPAFAWTATSVSCGVVEPRGVEPLTSSLRTRRSPN